MDSRTITIAYDEIGDILVVNFVPRHAAQETDMVSDFVLGVFNRESGRLEGVDVLGFTRHAAGGEAVSVDLAEVLPRETAPAART